MFTCRQLAGPVAATYAERSPSPATKLPCSSLAPAGAPATSHVEPRFTIKGSHVVGACCRSGAGEPLSVYPW